MEATILIASLNWQKVRYQKTRQWLRGKLSDEEYFKFMELYINVRLLMLGHTAGEKWDA